MNVGQNITELYFLLSFGSICLGEISIDLLHNIVAGRRSSVDSKQGKVTKSKQLTQSSSAYVALSGHI